MYTELFLLSQVLSANNIPIKQLKYNQSQIVVNIYSQNQFQPSQGNFRHMLEALGERETGLASGDSRQYNFVNPQLYFLGKYQFAEVLLIDKVVDLLVSGKVSQDPFGTSILAYLSEFGGYETMPEDFLLSQD